MSTATKARIPAWHPAWAREMSELYFSGATSLFLLHGNVHDLVALEEEGGKKEAREKEGGESGGGAYGTVSYGTVAEFLAEQVFGRWDLVLHYDLGRGLRAFAGRDGERLRQMVTLANQKVGDLSAARRDPAAAFAMIDRFLQNNIMAGEASIRAAVVIDHAGFLLPAGEPGRLSTAASQQIVTVLNWASSPHLKRLNMAVVLVDESAAALSERISANPFVADIAILLPEAAERTRFLRYAVGERELAQASDFTVEELGHHTAGITLADSNVLLQSAFEGGRRLDASRLRELKKDLIERQCRGLLEFIEPKYNLDVLICHPPVKQRLREDAQLLRRGQLGALPMGYLVCGPVGTGKSFMAQCMAGEIGIPCVTLQNFRSKYVGETEANLERVLGVLRAIGPVVVVIDEADATLGNREQEGDSGTSSRVFSMIAAQMGNTRYRGQILWMLLTCRPDLLPIDLKRQGRAEVHIPLFYPAGQEQLAQMFLAMAKKAKLRLRPEEVPTVDPAMRLSGADIEGIVTRAARRCQLRGEEPLTGEALAQELAGFLPSVEGLEKEMQELAALLECTDVEFVPEGSLRGLKEPGGRERLQERFLAIRNSLR